MDIEDLEPRKQKPKPLDFGDMSIESLHEYIAGLEAEIARAREAITAKETARQGADAVFKR